MQSPDAEVPSVTEPTPEKKSLSKRSRLPLVGKLSAALAALLGGLASDLPQVISSNPAALEPEKKPGSVLTIPSPLVLPEVAKSPIAQPTVNPTPETTQVSRAENPERKIAQSRIQENLFDLEDILGIPGAAKEYSENPGKTQYSTFSILFDAEGNEALFLVEKGPAGMEVEVQNTYPIQGIKNAVEVINLFDKEFIKDLAQDGVVAIASNLLKDENIAAPGKNPEFFSKESKRAGWQGSFVIVEGKGDLQNNPGIILFNKNQFSDVGMAARGIVAEGIALKHLRKNPNAIADGSIGSIKTLGAKNWIDKYEKAMEASNDPQIRDMPYDYRRHLDNDIRYYKLQPVQLGQLK